MFVIQTEEKPADDHFPHRVLVLSDWGLLHHTVEWRDDWSDEQNHSAAVMAHLLRSSGVPNWTPHTVVGAARLPDFGRWVTLIQEAD